MKRCVWLGLLFLNIVHANDDDFSLVNLTKSPIPRIAGTVNIVSGNWVDQLAHQETTGPDPYTVGHTYISSNVDEGSLADGWDLFHPSTLEVYVSAEISPLKKSPPTPYLDGSQPIKKSPSKEPHKSQKPPRDNKPKKDEYVHPTHTSKLFFRDSGGAVYAFKWNSSTLRFRPKIQKTGYNHISSIEQPYLKDPRRTRPVWNRDHDEWVVTLGDGTVRTYARTKRTPIAPSIPSLSKALYHIKEEILPSGNRRWFHYDDKKQLTTIQTVSSDKKDVLHYVTFKWHHDSVKIHTSENLTTTFSLKKIKDHDSSILVQPEPIHVVNRIERPATKNLHYTYCEKSSRHSRRIHKRTLPNGRVDTTKFYHEGKNTVHKSTIKISSQKDKDFLENRVRETWTQQFPDQHVRSHSFTYKEFDEHGETTVLDADDATTTYMWDLEHRPVWIGREAPDGTRLNSEHFIWGSDRDEGRLLRRTLLDETKTPIVDHEYEFDSDGNVVKEKFRGLFTGHSDKPLTFDGHKNVHGGESITWEAKYNDRSLKKVQIDPLDNWTYYEYDKDRSLLTAKLTCNQKNIIKREFFTYDEAAVCIKTVVDDGCSKDPSDLTNVSRRTIHKVKPRKQTPFYGSPDEERWYVWTPSGGKRLLKTEKSKRDSHGHVTVKELLDEAGTVQKRWAYAYDSFHRLIETVEPNGRFEKISYDESARIASKITPEATTFYSYDLFDRVIEEKKVFPDGTTKSLCTQRDVTGRTSTTIDHQGRTTTKIKDIVGRLIKTKLPALYTEQGVVRPKITISYAGALERNCSPSGAITEIFRSATGKPLTTTSPTGAVTHKFYDAKDHLVEEIDPAGLTTRYEYDALDRPTKVEQLFNGQSLSQITKRYVGSDLVEERHPTKIITYSYDSLGQKAEEKITDLLTNQCVTTTISYDPLHRPSRIRTVELNTEEQLTYDSADHIIERKTIGEHGEILSISTTTYDQAGRVIATGTGRNGTIAQTTTTYGAYGLPSVITYPDGTSSRFFYSPLHRWTDGHTYSQTITVDARGVTTKELRDSNDKVRYSVIKDPFGTIIAKTTTVFSILGAPTQIDEEDIVAGKTISSIRTHLNYDQEGHLITCTLAEGTPESATWTYQYDAIGRKITEIKPSGTSLSSSYDVKGRLNSYSSSDGTISWKYRYNVQGLPEQVENGVSGLSTYRQYNGLGTLIDERLENGLHLSYDISATGLTKAITYPDSSQSTYQYTSGLLSQIKRNDATYTVQSRDLSGLITEASLPYSCGQLTKTIDCMGRITTLRHQTFSERRTEFDAVGCCLKRTINGSEESFSYDYLSQLTSDNGRSATYDSLAQRLESEGVQATHNARHQVLSQGSFHYVYDKDGRRTSDSRYRYTYDACDRLVSVCNDAGRFTYTYDPFNRRLSSTTQTPAETSEERYFYQGDCEIGSVNALGQLTSLRVLGEGLGAEIGASVAFEINGTPYVPVHDLCGHVRVCLSPHSEIAETLSYTAFILESRSGSVTPWTFASKRQDPTGFIIFGQRFYDPQTATWLTQDPLGHTAGPNLYAYVKNNPLTLFDLFGLFEFCPEKVAYEKDGYTIYDNGIWRTSEIGQENVPHIELANGTWKDIVTKNAGSSYHVFGHINGMLTTCQQVHERMQQITKEFSGTWDNAMGMYNPTNGFIYDLFETMLSILGLERDVTNALEGELKCAADYTKQHGVDFRVDMGSHSEGASIQTNILSHEDFQKGKTYGPNIGTVSTFGAAKVSPDPLAENYNVKGDPVPFLNPTNWFEILSGHSHSVSPKEPSPLTERHDFDGPGYHDCLIDCSNRSRD